MVFSVLVWNVWHINQIEGQDRLNRLLLELKSLSIQHEPDCIVLSEVVQPSKNELPPVVEYLQRLGYNYSYYATMAHLPGYWMSGVAICSKYKLSDKQKHVISKNGSAAKHGYPNIDKEVISATMSLPQGLDIKVVAAHPTATVDGIRQHRDGIKSIGRLMHHKPLTQNTLLLGDMNQWRFMPRSLRSNIKDIMHVKTGSLMIPTWRYNAHRFIPIRLNLDYIYWSKVSNFQLQDFKVLPSNVSDHRPLLALFEYGLDTIS
jgi:endonuclease/exonuclease/phosphatase (EEP) superfamily protein YafD